MAHCSSNPEFHMAQFSSVELPSQTTLFRKSTVETLTLGEIHSLAAPVTAPRVTCHRHGDGEYSLRVVTEVSPSVSGVPGDLEILQSST